MLWAVIFVSLTFMEVSTGFRDTVPLIIRSVFALFVHCPFSFVSASQRWVALSVWLGQSVLYNSPLPSSKDPPFQNEAKCTTFFVKMSFICTRIKIISISKAEHLTSFWTCLPVRSSARNQQVSMLLVKASLLKMRWDSKYKKGVLDLTFSNWLIGTWWVITGVTSTLEQIYYGYIIVTSVW